MNNLANKIKTAILSDLQALVDGGVLGDVKEVDYSKDPLAGDYAKFPVAILGMSSIESQIEENVSNLRTYVFPIMILQQGEKISAQTDIEDLRDAILNKFDTDYSLQGTSVGATDPVASPAVTASTPDKSLIYFVITIKAKALYMLGT